MNTTDHASTTQLQHRRQISLLPIERVLLDFYADEYSRDRADIIRHALYAYVTADTSFSLDDFRRFVDTHIMPDLDDRLQKEALEAQLASFEADMRTRK